MIQKVFGSFMVVKEKHGKNTKLIELGGRDFNKIVTTMNLNFQPDQTTEIEANY